MLYAACLYLLLGSPHHSSREAATKELLHRVTGWPHLYGQEVVAWAKRTQSAEVAFRLRKPVMAYQSYLAASYTPPTPVWPCCDMMPGPSASQFRDKQAGRQWYLRAEGSGGRLDRGPYWHKYRRGTELMARDMIRLGTPRAEVDELLERMWRIECSVEADTRGSGLVLATWRRWDGGYPEPSPYEPGNRTSHSRYPRLHP